MKDEKLPAAAQHPRHSLSDGETRVSTELRGRKLYGLLCAKSKGRWVGWCEAPWGEGPGRGGGGLQAQIRQLSLAMVTDWEQMGSYWRCCRAAPHLMSTLGQSLRC